MALSAADFLLGYDEQEKYCIEDLRRFKCFETTLVISYARPFSNTRGRFPRFSFDLIGMQLDSRQQACHNELIELRDGAFAHSDKRMMQMSSAFLTIESIGNKEPVNFSLLRWVERPLIVGEKLHMTIELIKAVIRHIVSSEFPKMQSNPEDYTFHLDYHSQSSTSDE
ncbi:MAG: hypothetical protein EP335_06290 [Alphaproteobacteria bacterium]|nr:MAG: hypothetical protein EP335_06290 [Alphaproteobacteria bacterium]